MNLLFKKMDDHTAEYISTWTEKNIVTDLFDPKLRDLKGYYSVYLKDEIIGYVSYNNHLPGEILLTYELNHETIDECEFLEDIITHCIQMMQPRKFVMHVTEQLKNTCDIVKDLGFTESGVHIDQNGEKKHILTYQPVNTFSRMTV